MKYLLVAIGCLECGYPSNHDGIVDVVPPGQGLEVAFELDIP